MLENFLDATLGDKPETFNWEEALRKGPDPKERKSLPAHADACHFRQIENKFMFSQIRIAQYRDRKLLLMIVALVIIAKFIP